MMRGAMDTSLTFARRKKVRGELRVTARVHNYI